MRATLHAMRLNAVWAAVLLLIPVGYLVQYAPATASAWAQRWFGLGLYAADWTPHWGTLALGLLGWLALANVLAAAGHGSAVAARRLADRLDLRARLAAAVHMPPRERATELETEPRT